MLRKLKIILSHVLLYSSIGLIGVSCSNNNDGAQSNPQDGVIELEKKPESTDTTHNRKPQVSYKGNGDENSSVVKYNDGEMIYLSDGTIIEYSDQGDHNIVQKGTGIVIIYKNMDENELSRLTPEDKEFVLKDSEANPIGFHVFNY